MSEFIIVDFKNKQGYGMVFYDDDNKLIDHLNPENKEKVKKILNSNGIYGIIKVYDHQGNLVWKTQ